MAYEYHLKHATDEQVDRQVARFDRANEATSLFAHAFSAVGMALLIAFGGTPAVEW